MNDKEMLVEIEDIIRTAPRAGELSHDDGPTLDWLGRAEAISLQFPVEMKTNVMFALGRLHQSDARTTYKAEADIRRSLNAARWHYRMATGGPTSLAVDSGMVFDYFQGVAKLLQTARTDVLFVDPYLDAEFVERYLPSIDSSVPVRLLGRERQAQLVPAATAYASQHKHALEVRSAPGFHDRFVFIDGTQCVQSGASFKDGAKKTPTTLTEITDAFAGVRDTYESIWAGAKVDYKS